jgi:hypothetical protein
MEPDNTVALRLLAASCNTVGQRREGIAAAERAVALDPTDGANHMALAEVLALRAVVSPRRARAAAEEAVRLLPGETAPLCLLAHVEEIAGRGAVAASLYRKVLAVEPHNTEALLGLGRLSGGEAARAAVARAAGHTDPTERGALDALIGIARTRITAALLLFFSPFALVLSYAARPAGAAIACLLPAALAIGVAIGIAHGLAPRVARRWARGDRTWWLHDAAIARGQIPSPGRELTLAGLTFVLFFGLAFAALHAGGYLEVTRTGEMTFQPADPTTGEVGRLVAATTSPSVEQPWIRQVFVGLLVIAGMSTVGPLLTARWGRRTLERAR